MALTKVRGGGVDNPLTLGGGSASDRSIVFDGNAQDFHIGLDDSTDSLTIGLGSTLGTTPYMVVDASGHVTKPSNPAFRVTTTGSTNTSSEATIPYNTELHDIGNNYNTSNYRFTAPIDGTYSFSAAHWHNTGTAGMVYVKVYLNGVLNAEFRSTRDQSDNEYHRIYANAEINLSSGDYVEIRGGGANGGEFHSSQGQQYSYFAGHLIG